MNIFKSTIKTVEYFHNSNNFAQNCENGNDSSRS